MDMGQRGVTYLHDGTLLGGGLQLVIGLLCDCAPSTKVILLLSYMTFFECFTSNGRMCPVLFVSRADLIGSPRGGGYRYSMYGNWNEITW